MGTESASADAERKKAADSKPAADDKRMGTVAAGGGAAPPAAAGVSLGERQLQKKAVVGGADDESEKKADQAADHVMRMADPTKQATSASQGPAPAAGPASSAAATSQRPATEQPVRRAADPATEQKVPGTPTAKPVGTGSAGGPGPDTATPAGPAPMVSPPIAAGSKPAEAGTPAPEPEPPAPAGEAPARGTPAVSPDLQDYLDASRGKGAPLPDAVRKEFEAKFQRPFDDVRIHDDAAADDAARRIDALAFTRGNDIYFRSGAYDPTTPEGRKLLAHELAHVVQQRPGVNRKSAPGLGGALISRAKPKTSEPKKIEIPDEDKGPTKKLTGTGGEPSGEVDTSPSKKTLTIDRLSFPKWKKNLLTSTITAPYEWRRDERGNTPQLQNWKNEVRAQTRADTKAQLDGFGKKAAGEPYFAKLGKPSTIGEKGKKNAAKGQGKASNTEYFVGSPDQIAEMLLVPTFSRTRNWKYYDVDHKVDWQITGRQKGIENAVGNLWLFWRPENRLQGPLQAERIRKAIDSFMNKADPYLKPKPRRKTVMTSYTVSFGQLVFDAAGTNALSDEEYWQLADINKIKPATALEEVAGEELAALRGKPNELVIFSRAGGGRVKPVPIEKNKPKIEWEKKISHGRIFKITDVFFKEPAERSGDGNAGRVEGEVLKDNKILNVDKPLKVDLREIPGLPYAASLSRPDIQMSAKGLSPVQMPEIEFDPFDGPIGRGKILPSGKLLKNLDVELVLDASGIGIEALLTADSLDLPGPFQITSGSLRLYAGTGGLAVNGRIDFEIEKLAKGYLQAGAESKGGAPKFELEGALDFDSKMFDEARIKLWYRDEKWGASGTLAIEKADKIKGIKRAKATVGISDETITAAGEFEPSIKGIEKGSLGFKYDEKTGTEITGEILLGEGIPGIKSGKLAATIKDGPDKHSLSGDLSLEPSVPGLTGEVKGRYDDGMFSVDAQLGYEKGFAKGTVHLGVTNQPIGADGKPAGAPKPDGSVTVYGEGSVTLQLTPWLTGTVGLKLTPDGQVEVSGEVALPPTFNVFDEKKIEKELLSIHVDIPIIGVAVAGQRIGIFASIGGAVRIEAGVGPGQLRDVALKVTYNPTKPEATTVTGNAKFAVPAHAALRLSVDGSVGAGIPVVSAKAGLEVFGEIGVAGEASAATAVTWTPAAGVVLDARGEIYVEPKFKFGINAFVDVSADLWVTTIELYHETWKLAQFEYGSNLRFGLALPVHYESGKPFDISYDQIQWTYPHIEPMELISGLVKQIVG